MDTFYICIWLVHKVHENDKLENAAFFFYLFFDLYTTDDTERIHETERMQTPRPHRVNALLPFTTTISCIKSARTTIKKALFDPARNPNINRKMLSTRFRKNLSKKVSLSTDYIFYQKKGENMRKAIAKSQKMLVGEFLRRSENSNELPGKKDQIRGRGTFSLTDTMQNIYRKFCLEFSDIKMSFTAFCKGRPSNVKLIRYTQRHVCLCQRHTNMSVKATASKYCRGHYLN